MHYGSELQATSRAEAPAARCRAEAAAEVMQGGAHQLARHLCRMEHLTPRFWTSVPKQQERPEQILVLRLTAKALEASAKATSKLAAGTLKKSTPLDLRFFSSVSSKYT